MKKLMVSTAALVLLGVGSVFAYTQTEEPKEETVKEMNVQETSRTVAVNEEKVEKPSTENTPTERTVDLGPDKPWQRMYGDEIIGQQNNGEIIYLLSDAEELENSIASFANERFEDLNDKSKNVFANSKEQMADSWAGHVTAFVNGVSKDYNNVGYFAKMDEVKKALESKDYQSIPALISEAKKMR